MDIEQILIEHNLWSGGAGGQKADLRGADLCSAKLSGINLCRAKLSGADLRGAKLRVANLCRADLSGAKLGGANLSGADLRGADMRVADLRGAKLSGADMRGADLRGAKLDDAKLGGANLSGAIVPFSGMVYCSEYFNYSLSYQADAEGIFFVAGCNIFDIDEARDHWGSSEYPDAARGRRMLDVCEMLYRWWQDGILPGVGSDNTSRED